MSYSIGLDFGTDSVRALVVNNESGMEVSTAVEYYPRWKKGLYCDPTTNQFRQHPLDYIESLEKVILKSLDEAGPEIRSAVKGIGVDTTGSTPVAVDGAGVPLALIAGLEENPNAMFILWKDHTAVKEAAEINELARSWGGVDFTKYVGGIYSSEWFWAKALHIMRKDEIVANNLYSWVEHCDWIPFLLTGGQSVMDMKRSRCAAGHKAMWHQEFSGVPSDSFLTQLDPVLDGLRDRLFTETYTSDIPAGQLSEEWASRLGLSTDVVVAVGAFDAHMGAVGGQIEPYFLSKVMGTSTCDMLVAPNEEVGNTLVSGICGQVDGSVIPHMLGMEAGQSAFGDVYAWFKNLIAWPVVNILNDSSLIDESTKEQLIKEVLDQIIPRLSEAAAKVSPAETTELALDWLNGRRTPDANQLLKGALFGLNLGSDAVRIFKALVEATCFGARQIIDRFESEGVPIKGVIGLGGVAKKSPYVMQTMADVLNRPIKIVKSEQTCALGAAMFAATAAGAYTRVEEAMEKMGQGFDQIYQPNAGRSAIYNGLYLRYQRFGKFIEKETL